MPKVSKVPKVGKENTNTKARREYLERTKVPKMPKVSKVPKVGKENTNTKARGEYLERTKVPKMPKVSKVSDEAVSTQRSAFSLKHPPLLSCLPFFVLS